MAKMSFIEWLKEYDNFDRYILFLLSLDFSVQQVADLVHMTRAHVYNVIERDTKLIERYQESLGEALRRALEERHE